jgi:mannose/fructose/N-acetylgalactosamine-specific phosphotransferase system component IIB
MSLVLVRIDDRLVHGQVVVGWGIHLKPNRIILCSDTIASSPWEKEIYMGAEATAPYPLTISVLTTDETLLFLNDTGSENEKIVILVETPQDVLELVKKGLKVEKINVGGMHYKQGKRRLASYIFVDNLDISCFKEISKMKIELEGRDVPTGKTIDIIKAIESLE